MKGAIMQPYLLPYIGYYQLIKEVDTFIYLDDVNYIKKGYVNSNEVIINDNRYRFTLPLKKASQNVLINSLYIAGDTKQFTKLLKTLEINYKNCRNQLIVENILRVIHNHNKELLTSLIYSLNDIIFDFLKIDTAINYSSSHHVRGSKGQDRIIELCLITGISTYINPIGGKAIYNDKAFEDSSLQLFFHKKLNSDESHQDLSKSKDENLSILDVIANFDREVIIDSILPMYEIIK